MLNWFKHGKIKVKLPQLQFYQIQGIQAAMSRRITAANDFVSKIQRFSDMSSPTEIFTPKKRERNEQYSMDIRAKMVIYCFDNGSSKSARYFSSKLGKYDMKFEIVMSETADP